jgi:hypothetical protein
MNYTACLVLIGVAERARSKCHSTRVSAAADWQFAHSTRAARATSQPDTFLPLLPVSPLHVRSANKPWHASQPAKASFCAKVTDKNFLYISGWQLYVFRVRGLLEWKKWHAARCCMMICRLNGHRWLESKDWILSWPFLIFLSPAKCNHCEHQRSLFIIRQYCYKMQSMKAARNQNLLFYFKYWF